MGLESYLKCWNKWGLEVSSYTKILWNQNSVGRESGNTGFSPACIKCKLSVQLRSSPLTSLGLQKKQNFFELRSSHHRGSGCRGQPGQTDVLVFAKPWPGVWDTPVWWGWSSRLKSRFSKYFLGTCHMLCTGGCHRDIADKVPALLHSNGTKHINR